MYQLDYKLIRDNDEITVRVYLVTSINSYLTTMQFMDIKWKSMTDNNVETLSHPSIILALGNYSVPFILPKLMKDLELSCLNGNYSPEAVMALLEIQKIEIGA